MEQKMNKPIVIYPTINDLKMEIVSDSVCELVKVENEKWSIAPNYFIRCEHKLISGREKTIYWEKLFTFSQRFNQNKLEESYQKMKGNDNGNK